LVLYAVKRRDQPNTPATLSYNLSKRVGNHLLSDSISFFD
jgi:hypothetical protein